MNLFNVYLQPLKTILLFVCFAIFILFGAYHFENINHIFLSEDQSIRDQVSIRSKKKVNLTNISKNDLFDTTLSFKSSLNTKKYVSSTQFVQVPSSPTPELEINDDNEYATSNTKIHAQITTSKRTNKYLFPQKSHNSLIPLSIPPSISSLPNLHIVNFTGLFLHRLEKYNKFISNLRTKFLKKRGISAWKDIQPANKFKVVWGNSDNFFEKLANIPSIELVVLPWLPGAVSSNLPNSEYFKWTATDQLCHWIETPAFTKAHWDAVYNRTCNRNPLASQHPSQIEAMYLYSKPVNVKHYWPNDGLFYPQYFFQHPPPYTLYLTIVHDAIVNLNGDVISGAYKIVPYTCSHDSIPTIPNEYSHTVIYSEVLVVTQFWGTSYFHRLSEVLPRIAPYISFLKQHPSILIHAPEEGGKTAEMMEVMGMARGRLVSGIIRAKTIYLPQGTPCGFPQPAPTQVFSHLFKQFIHHNISVEVIQKVEQMSLSQKKQFQGSDHPFSNLPPSTQPLSKQKHSTLRNKLVLIERSGLRKFLHQRQILKALATFSSHHHLEFFFFHDSPPPDLHSTMLIFNSAIIIVAPHGAGLTNSLFSQTGTLVIEGVCNPPDVNMCYQFLTYLTSLRYHGIPSKGGCEGHIDVTPEEIVEVLNQYVSIMKLGAFNNA